MRRKPLRRQITAGVLAFILSIASLGAFRFGAFRACGAASDDAEITAAGVASGDVYYYGADGQRVYVESVSKAWEEAVSLGTGMGITADLRCGRLSLPKNRAVFVELNGRILSRGLAGAASDGEIFYVDDDAALTIYGGTADNPACAMEQIHTVRAYEVDGKGELTEASKTVYGGVLTGGFSRNHAGGIEMRKGSSVRLVCVALVGNRAEQHLARNGYGGGIRMEKDYGKLALDRSVIAYNYAYNDGGGIYADGDNCRVTMTGSRIDGNACADNGGGIAVAGSDFRLTGDATIASEGDGTAPELTALLSDVYDGTHRNTLYGSTIANNAVTQSASGGGGVYLKKSGATLTGVNILGNRAFSGGNGGGVCSVADHITLAGCVIAGNEAFFKTTFRIRQGGLGGGIYVGNDLTAVRDCRITDNYAEREGGGAYVSGSVDLLLGGVVIAENNLAERGKCNIFLDAGMIQSAYLVVSGLSGRSRIGLTLSAAHTGKIACGSTVSFTETNRGETIDQRSFVSDSDTVYYYWNSENNQFFDESAEIVRKNSLSYNYRWLIALPASRMPEGYGEKTEANPREPGSVTEVGTYEAEGTEYALLHGVAGIPSSVDDTEDIAVDFYYSDGYFAGNPRVYNEHLATMSCILASAAGASNRVPEGLDSALMYSVKTQNIRQLLLDIGVSEEDIHYNDFNKQKPGTDTMGVTIGSRKIGNRTLVIIGTRGSGYEAEWASNFTLGSTGEAAGFKSAADVVLKELEEYLAARGINGESDRTVFWLAGYSRGGATAGMAAARIIDRYDPEGRRTFAYTFEAPRGGVRSEAKEAYACIHNIVNPADPVPYAAPAEMGFVRYGTDHVIPGTAAEEKHHTELVRVVVRDASGRSIRPITAISYRDNSALSGDAYDAARRSMLLCLSKINDELIFDDYFADADVSLAQNAIYGSNVSSVITELDRQSGQTAEQFLSRFFRDLQECGFNFAVQGEAKTRDFRRFYSQEIVFGDVTFEAAVAELFEIVYSLRREQKTELLDIFESIPERMGTDVLPFSYLLISDKSWYEYESYAEIGRGMPSVLMDRLWEMVNTGDVRKGYKALSEVLDEEQLAAVHAVWKSLVFPILCWIKADYDRSGERLQTVGTLAYNAERLVQNHFPEITLAWLASADGWYGLQADAEP